MYNHHLFQNSPLFNTDLQGWGVDCDEVVAGLFIGDKAAASSVPFLRRQVCRCQM